MEELLKPGREVVVVVCLKELRWVSEKLSADLVLTARLCCISGQTYCHANPKMMFVFSLNQSTGPRNATALINKVKLYTYRTQDPDL